MQALVPIAADYGIEPRHLLAVIEGCEMDLRQSRYLDFAGLARYCHLVAGEVGEVAANIFGRSEAGTIAYAHRLGLAMQLTNIIRDVGDDARRGRIYLPLDEMAAHGVSPADILSGRETEGFRTLMDAQVERAESYYARALSELPEADRSAQRPGLIMAAIYRTLLAEIKADGCHVLRQRIALTPMRKLWIAWRTWVFGG
jgi:phytoene synthase